MTTNRDAAGAYGFRLLGLDGARSLLVPAPAAWPPLEVAVAADAPGPPCDRVGPDRAELKLLTGGWVGIDRSPGRAVYHLPRHVDHGSLVHPYLAPVALIAARWLGRESFHAGAFVVDGGVWALLGDKEAGKSTTLAWLAAHGRRVVCDDALVLDGSTALAGPRSIDLRAESAQRLGIGEPLGRSARASAGACRSHPCRPSCRSAAGCCSSGETRWPSSRCAARRACLRCSAPRRPARARRARPLIEYAAPAPPRLRRPLGWGSLRDGAERLLEAIAR